VFLYLNQVWIFSTNGSLCLTNQRVIKGMSNRCYGATAAVAYQWRSAVRVSHRTQFNIERMPVYKFRQLIFDGRTSTRMRWENALAPAMRLPGSEL
jgi:hypothetical protein